MARAASDKRVQHYRSSTPGTVPILADLLEGELFVNTADRKIFTSNGTAVVEIPIEAIINNTLTSTSTTEALSANQGKVLKDLIDGLGTIHNAATIAARDALAAAGTVDTLDLVHVDDDGDGKWARYQNLGTSAAPVWVKIADEDALAAGLGATNLSVTASPTGTTVNNSSGSNAVLPLADTTNAGQMSPADKIKLNAYPVNPVDTIVELTDTPSSITASTLFQGNAAGNAMEFSNVIDGGSI